MNELQSLTKVKDIEAFQRQLGATVKLSPLLGGAAWGRSVAELWNWGPRYEEEWARICRFLTQLDVAPETYTASTSSRMLAEDRPEPKKCAHWDLETCSEGQ